MLKPKLFATNRNFAILDRRCGDDISIDIRAVLCTAEVDGKQDIIHPIVNNAMFLLVANDIMRPEMNNISDTI